MLSVVRPLQVQFATVFRRADMERRLALVLAIGAVVCGIATYVAFSRSPPYGPGVGTVLVLLNLDLAFLLLLGVIVARRIARLVAERRQGSAGSQLHVTLVALFSVLAATPAILVAIFSVVFLSNGLETWFSGRVRQALDNSLAVAEAYLAEHKEVIRADALAMATDLENEGPRLLDNLGYLRHVVVAQAALRSLTEAIVFDGSGEVLAHSGLGFALEVEQLPESAMRRAAEGEVVTLTSAADDRVRALVRLDSLGDLFLFVGRFVDPRVLTFMDRTQRVVDEYRRMELERSQIQIASALIFAVVALLLLLAAVYVGLNVADRLAAPIRRLAIAADRVRAGDLSARVPEGAEAELGRLSTAFNRMTAQLDTQRRQLMGANEELEDRRRFTEAVLGGVTAGVIGTDADRLIILPNRSAAAFFEGVPEHLIGRSLDTLLPEARELFADAARRAPESVQGELAIARNEQRRNLLVRIAPQLHDGIIEGYVVTFDDITDLVSAQRQAAWSEVARRVAHEVKNPLTPIRLSAERLNRRFLSQIADSDRESYRRAIDTIVQQVDTIGRLIGEFSAFARMPVPEMRRENVTELLRDAVLFQRNARPRLSLVEEYETSKQLVASCDQAKLQQVFTNLLQNSIDALGDQGAPTIWVRAAEQDRQIVIEIEDNGPGFGGRPSERLFEPYVTTKRHGTGLGLAIVKKIMEEHGGSVELAEGRYGGALVRLALPRN